MQVIRYPESNEISELIRRPVKKIEDIINTVKPILHEVKVNGDEALRKYSKEFDLVDINNLKVEKQEISNASELLDDELKQAVHNAKGNIEKFHRAQKFDEGMIKIDKGIECWRKSVAIEKVGLYIPGGTSPLFSTVLMLGIPAKLAGCSEIVLCTPADKNGDVNPAILYTASLIGIEKIFKAGGAQAIAAMAYGTESVPKVYKIFGPGNQYVTTAKQLVMNEGVAIDMPAGPSEVAVVADNSADPAFVAADLLSQAEHGPDSQVLLITPDEGIIEKVITEVDRQLEKLSRKDFAEQSLDNSKIVLVKDIDEAINISNKYAPEHLILAAKNSENAAEKIINAGSVFIGNFSPESAGDYASGTNHTLPTNGFAKSYSGVSLDSFVKKITFQKLSAEGLGRLASTIETMAEAEGLDAHRNAVSIRLKQGRGES
jgi:histidinol dehydrogenase